MLSVPAAFSVLVIAGQLVYRCSALRAFTILLVLMRALFSFMTLSAAACPWRMTYPLDLSALSGVWVVVRIPLLDMLMYCAEVSHPP
jgi:hypothetical protein